MSLPNSTPRPRVRPVRLCRPCGLVVVLGSPALERGLLGSSSLCSKPRAGKGALEGAFWGRPLSPWPQGAGLLAWAEFLVSICLSPTLACAGGRDTCTRTLQRPLLTRAEPGPPTHVLGLLGAGSILRSFELQGRMEHLGGMMGVGAKGQEEAPYSSGAAASRLWGVECGPQ